LLSDGRPKSEAPLSEARLDGRRKTLPPPEWTSPRAGSTRPPTMSAEPLPRRAGTRAEEAWLRARVEEARAASDRTRLRDACTTLARWLASRERDLDEAVELGTTALSLGADLELRREVSAWLESLGEASRAASVLKPVMGTTEIESSEVAYVLVRTGILKARAGAAAGASAAFAAAMSIDATDALPAELTGALSAWQPDAVSASAGAEAYVEAARRRVEQGQEDAALEDLWRAFSADPACEMAAVAVADALSLHGRPEAADEVLRAHARALWTEEEGKAAAIHARRRAMALEAGDPLRALGAAIDQSLDSAVEGEEAQAFDALLLGAGMLDALAARLELRAEQAASPADRAGLYAELGRLSLGPLSDPVRALSAYAAAIAADSSCDAAIGGLRALLQDLPRASSSGDDGRPSDPLRALLSSIDEIPDEPQRLALLSEKLARVVPRVSAFFHPAEDGSEDAAAHSRAWVRASFAREPRATASSLERLAVFAAPPLAATLLCAAVDRHAQYGDREAARRCAESAVVVDPGHLRAIATLADCVVGDVGGEGASGAAAALERAIALTGPRLAWCTALADAFDAIGQIDRAVAWSQRCVAMRPGDIGAIERLLDRLLRSGDGGRLADALAWLLSQPQPLGDVAAPFGRSLRELSRIDADRAAIVARRALDVFGPKSAHVRDALLDAASRAGDEAFVAAVFERWLSCGTESGDRRHLFVRLAELYERLGDEDGEARVVARAVREGLGSGAIDSHLERLAGRPATPDAQLWRMTALANRLVPGDDPDSAAWAWRELGGALWDLAEDRVNAIAAWERAARIAGSGGHSTFALDLVAFAGPTFAFEYLGRLIDSEPDDRAAAAIAADVARAALAIGEPSIALDLAARGVERCPSWAAAIEVAEVAASRSAGFAALSSLYDRIATRAMGRFGQRAAHYRGARFFERRGEARLAVRHAAFAFVSLPSDGSSFPMLARVARKAGDRLQAVQAVEGVAEQSEKPETRAMWLLRAASLCGEGHDDAKRRVDLVLRALASHPTARAVDVLGEAIQSELRIEPDERDALEMRVARATRAVTERLAGPDGARVSIAFAKLALALFDDGNTAFGAFERAFAYDADVDEFDALAPHAKSLGALSDAGRRADALLAQVESLQANAGPPALRVISAMALARQDLGLAARAAVLLAMRDPEDDALVIAADEAVRRDPQLAPKLGTRVPPARRAEALVGQARSLAAAEHGEDAARLFERALGLVGEDARVEILAEIRAARRLGPQEKKLVDVEPAAGAESEGDENVRAAERWSDIADVREHRDDLAGAVRAHLEACRLDPEPLERWSSLERVAELAGDGDARVLALERILTKVGAQGKVAAYRRLARAHTARDDKAAAERVWRALLALEPNDEEADQQVEAIVVREGRFADLAEHLARRADRLATDLGRAEMLRAVRLRRAAVLEQHLGRVEEACVELERLLASSPDNSGGLRYLADLLERQSEYARAAALWARAARIEPDPVERDDLDLRASHAARAAGDLTEAFEAAGRVVQRDPSNVLALEARCDCARELGADVELGEALEVLSGMTDDNAVRAELLVEGALAAARTGQLDIALSRAFRAAGAVPHRATPQLLARGLEYRLRGAGAPDEARATIEHLGEIRESLGHDDVALRAFLLAEALDVVQGQAAGFRELDAVASTVGDHPLVALGFAERLAAQGQAVAAVEAYRRALAGPFLGLRSPSAVAMSAADCASRAGLPNDALQFLDIAERYEDTRAAAQAWRTLLAEDASPRSLRLPVTQAQGNEADAVAVATESAPAPGDRARAHFALGKRRADRGDVRGAELLLREALSEGLVEAGDALADLLRGAPDRARDLLRIRRQQVALEPGDAGRLDALRASAQADGDSVYAAAIEHVLVAVGRGAHSLVPSAHPSALPPPPLAAQPEQPGIFTLLTRPSSDNIGEALALLWEGAAQLFTRDASGQSLPDASSYSAPGIERIVPGARPAIARMYELAIRVLDAPRIPLFAARAGTSGASGPPASRVGLLWPPSVFLSGDVRQESTELLFELGRGMSAALPQNVLCLGLPPSEGRAVVEALRVAFAPPEPGRQVESRAARLAESFWNIVPARTQRRIQLLLSGGSFPEYDYVVERALQSGRRVGMFLSGDFGHTARSLLTGRPGGVAALQGNLRALCEELPMLADLLRLAVSPEYASARWHGVDSGTARRLSVNPERPAR
jgi:tetratricopeptide (TPR) repeat protein